MAPYFLSFFRSLRIVFLFDGRSLNLRCGESGQSTDLTSAAFDAALLAFCCSCSSLRSALVMLDCFGALLCAASACPTSQYYSSSPSKIQGLPVQGLGFRVQPETTLLDIMSRC